MQFVCASKEFHAIVYKYAVPKRLFANEKSIPNSVPCGKGLSDCHHFRFNPYHLLATGILKRNGSVAFELQAACPSRDKNAIIPTVLQVPERVLLQDADPPEDW